MGNRGKESTQAIMDGILRFVAAGGFVAAAMVAPNSPKIFEKPIDMIMNTLDKRAQSREINRVLRYMKQRGLIQYQSKDYENGIVLTKTGKEQLRKRHFETLSIRRPPQWDSKWRLVFFDIPEQMRDRRVLLTRKLRLLGFQKLQQSIWVHPFPSRDVIEAVTETIDIRKFVSYVEILEIDGDEHLRDRFKNLIR